MSSAQHNGKRSKCPINDICFYSNPQAAAHCPHRPLPTSQPHVHNVLRPLLPLPWHLAAPSHLCRRCPIHGAPLAVSSAVSGFEKSPLLTPPLCSPPPPTRLPAANTPCTVCLLICLLPERDSLRTGAEIFVFVSPVLSKVLSTEAQDMFAE